MGRAFGFIGILIVAALGFYIYSKQATALSPEGKPKASPRATIDLAAVKNDLLQIAQAERGEFALNGKYVSLEQLQSSGALSMKGDGRGPYHYAVEVGDTSFRVTATYGGEPMAGMPAKFSIDETMQIHTE
jgi:hypothetical protein